MRADEPLPVLDPAVEVAAYRVVTEAVANAAQHSDGTRCQVLVTREDGGLLVEILDDGTGLRVTTSQGVGLRSMTARGAGLGERLRGFALVRADVAPGRAVSVAVLRPRGPALV